MNSITFKAITDYVVVNEGENLLFNSAKRKNYMVKIIKLDVDNVYLMAKDARGFRYCSDSILACKSKLSSMFCSHIVKHRKGRKVLATYYPY